MYAPPEYRDVVRTIVDRSGLRGGLADAPRRLRVPPNTKTHTVVDDTRNTAIVQVREVGDDLAEVIAADRDRLFALSRRRGTGATPRARP